MDQFVRTRMLLGDEGLDRLRQARVAVFGVGGVGGYAAEALARSGVGALDLFDDDRVALSNLNRQILALHSTLDRPKTEALGARLLDINPSLDLRTRQLFYLPASADEVDLSVYDWVADAVDTVSAKLELAVRCFQLGVPLISALGAGNRLDPTRLRVGDLYETSGDGLARVMRKELRRRGVPALRVVYSTEPAVRPLGSAEDRRAGSGRRDVPGSAAFVPAAMGMTIAAEIVRALALRGAEPERMHDPGTP